MTNRRRQSKAFTVVELMVALSLSAGALLSGYHLCTALRTTHEIQTQRLERLSSSLIAIERISQDLCHAMPVAPKEQPTFAGGNPKSGADAPVLDFYALCGTGPDERVCGIRRLCHVTYSIRKKGDSLCLLRKATPIIASTGQGADQGGSDLAEGLENLTLAFYDGRTSSPQYSSKDTLPVHVEIRLTIGGHTWPLTVQLPCGRGSEGGPS